MVALKAKQADEAAVRSSLSTCSDLSNVINLIGTLETELLEPQTARQHLKWMIFLVQLESDSFNKNISKRF